MGLLRTIVWLPSVVFRLIMKGDLLHTKNNITLRWSSNHHKTLMLRLPHDISLLSFHYSKLVSIKGLATFRYYLIDGPPFWANNTGGKVECWVMMRNYKPMTAIQSLISFRIQWEFFQWWMALLQWETRVSGETRTHFWLAVGTLT